MFLGYYRAEEIPPDEVSMATDEIMVQVAHFHKEARSTFGVPFLMKVNIFLYALCLNWKI